MNTISSYISNNGTNSRQVMLVAGEVSADEHAALLLEELGKRDSDLHVFGMGGSKLRAVGMETVVDSEKAASVMGFTEVFGSLKGIYQAYKRLVREASARRPDVVILMDFPDFNFFIARAMRKLGIPVLYFISPQLWAWRQGRIKTIRECISRLAVIFPFEADFYRQFGVKADFVGHPLCDQPREPLNRAKMFETWDLDPTKSLLAILPGSRKGEVKRLLAPKLAAFELIKKRHPGLQAIIPVAPSLEISWMEGMVGNVSGLRLVRGQAREVLSLADVGLVASGTATVEAAFCGVPFVVSYVLSPFSYVLGRILVRGVKYFAMPNLIAGEMVVPELLQGDVNPRQLAIHVDKILDDAVYRTKMIASLEKVKEKLQFPATEVDESSNTVAGRVSDIVLEMIASANESSQVGSMIQGEFCASG